MYYSYIKDICLPIQSIVETRDATVPVLVEIGLDRVVKDLGERDVAHVSRTVPIDLDRIVGAVLAASEQEHEQRNEPHLALTVQQAAAAGR